MTTVYVVERVVKYEGSILLGIFSTAEKAHKAFIKGKPYERLSDDEWGSRWSEKSEDWMESIFITPREVDKA